MRYFYLLFLLAACAPPPPAAELESPEAFLRELTELVRRGDEAALFERFVNTRAEATTLVTALSSASRDTSAVNAQIANMVAAAEQDRDEVLDKFLAQTVADWSALHLDSVTYANPLLKFPAEGTDPRLRVAEISGWYSRGDELFLLKLPAAGLDGGPWQLQGYPLARKYAG